MTDNQTEMSSLPRISNRSLAEEVISHIEEAIRSAVLKPGQKLLSEPVLAAQLGVSRNTLREAVNILVDKGVLYRMRGIGTFVSGQSEFMLQTNLEEVISTSSVIRNKGHVPGQHGFKLIIESASELVAKQLQLDPGKQVIHISRIRTADGVPVIFSEEYISQDLLVNVPLPYEAENLDNWSIYNHLLEAGFTIDLVMTRIKSQLVDRRIAKLLDMKEGQTLLRMEQTHFSKNNIKPILFCINYHNDSIIDVEVIRKG